MNPQETILALGQTLSKLNALKQNTQLERKTLDVQEPMVVEQMLQLQMRAVPLGPDASAGFLVLEKNTNPSTFNDERKQEFFRALLPAILSQQVQTVDQCVDMFNKYMALFAKKKVKVSMRKTQPRQRGVGDLVEYLQQNNEAGGQ